MKKISYYRVLLVEDEQLIRNSLAKRITELDSGFQVVAQTSNGIEALDILEHETIHLVITDIRMPGMNGLELSRFIHDHYPHMFTIILSGYADFSYAKEAIQYHVFEYLLKPVNIDDLESTLCKVRLKLQNYIELQSDSQFSSSDAQSIVEYTTLYIREHYMEDIDISSLASQLGFSSSYLTKIFNKYKGDTPLKHLTEVRIHEAKQLLSNTNLSIREVGERVGYPDQFHFSKTFRKLTGINPTAFRKQQETPDT